MLTEPGRPGASDDTMRGVGFEAEREVEVAVNVAIAGAHGQIGPQSIEQALDEALGVAEGYES
jgi:hypothetical protein